jgi:KaiC/GvpD/RAD55 family RecA-like ATPase
METVKKKLEEFANLRVQVQKQAEAIKEDKDLTLGARSRKLKELKEETDEKLVRLREEYRETVANLRERLYIDALGYKTRWNEQPGERERYLQILNEVSGKSPQALLTLLKNATYAGDRLTPKAVLKEAFERDLPKLTETCLQMREDLREPLEKVIEFERTLGEKRDASAKFVEKVALSGVYF